MENNEQYLSLYEYLGKPAGGELGKQIFERAKSQNIKVNSVEISNPKYTGKVLTYPKSFLDNEFKQSEAAF